MSDCKECVTSKQAWIRAAVVGIVAGTVAVNFGMFNPHKERASAAEAELAAIVQERDDVASALAECSGKSLRDIAKEHGAKEAAKGLGKVLDRVFGQ